MTNAHGAARGQRALHWHCRSIRAPAVKATTYRVPKTRFDYDLVKPAKTARIAKIIEHCVRRGAGA